MNVENPYHEISHWFSHGFPPVKVLKEGGKRGVEIEGAADMGGLQCPGRCDLIILVGIELIKP